MRQIGSIKWFGRHNKSNGKIDPFGFIAPLSGEDLFCHKEQFSQKLIAYLAENRSIDERVVTYEIGKRKTQGEVREQAVDVRFVDEENELEPLKAGFLSMKTEVWLPATFRLFDLLSALEVVQLLKQKAEALPAIAFYAQNHIRLAKLLLSEQAQELRNQLPPQFALRLYAAAENIDEWFDAIILCKPPHVNLKSWESFCKSVETRVVCGSRLFFEFPPETQERILESEDDPQRLTPCFLAEDDYLWQLAAKKLFRSLSNVDIIPLVQQKLTDKPGVNGLVVMLPSGVKSWLLLPEQSKLRKGLTPNDRLELYQIAQNLDEIIDEILACHPEVPHKTWENFCKQIGGEIRCGSKLFFMAPPDVQNNILVRETNPENLITCFMSSENHLWKTAAEKLFTTQADHVILELIERKLKAQPGVIGLMAQTPTDVKRLLLNTKEVNTRRLLTSDDRLELYRIAPHLEEIIEEVLECRNSEKWVDFCIGIQDRISYADALYKAAPDRVKIQVLTRQFQELFRVIDGITQSDHVQVELEPEVAYRGFNQEDRALAQKWMGDTRNLSDEIRDRIEAQMISARSAEKVAQWFYRSLGYQVIDIAITQCERGSDDWKTYDILLNSPIPEETIIVDVKNARTPISSRTDHKRRYVEHCVPRFKEIRNKEDVTVAGVLSPYLKLEDLLNPASLNYSPDPVTFLGETTKTGIKNLESEFRKRAAFEEISICLESRTRDGKSTWVIPAWAFDYPPHFYTRRNESRERLRRMAKDPIPTLSEFATVGINPLPAFLASGIPLPENWQGEITRGQRYFYNLWCSRGENGISLPFLFLGLLTHFVEMLKHKDRWDAFEPNQYQRLLYAENSNSGKNLQPLGIVDPLGIIDDFIDTLSILWKNKGYFNLHEYEAFRFNGLGLLRGRRRNQKRFETILAYCGGKIEKQGKCGKSPLIVGREKTCEVCGHLICSNPKCGFCSYADYGQKTDCPGRAQRKEQQKFEANIADAPNWDDNFDLGNSPWASDENPDWIPF